ncbi:Uncharacterised protein r2_g2351 [Pycnogonum litorale]
MKTSQQDTKRWCLHRQTGFLNMASSQDQSLNSAINFKWTDERVLRLIQKKGEKKNKFTGRKNSAKVVWQ